MKEKLYRIGNFVFWTVMAVCYCGMITFFIVRLANGR